MSQATATQKLYFDAGCLLRLWGCKEEWCRVPEALEDNFALHAYAQWEFCEGNERGGELWGMAWTGRVDPSLGWYRRSSGWEKG